MNNDITEQDIDKMNDIEQQFQEEEARKTPQEKIYDRLEALKIALRAQQHIMDDIAEIIGKLGKV